MGKLWAYAKSSQSLPTLKRGEVSKLLGIVDKNSRERIEVRAAEYQGHPYIDIRTYWKGKDGDLWRPSRKGVTLKPELVADLIAVLKKAAEAEQKAFRARG